MMEKIGDYAVIGDCRSAALISRSGSIDWLCWPRFDSPSIFDAIINEGGGQWSLRPTVPFRVERKYEYGTNVLRTTFLQGENRVELTDLMPVSSERDKKRLLLPDHEILRVARCEQGEMELEMRFEPRPDYGRMSAQVHATPLAFRVQTPQGLLALRTQIPVECEGGRVLGRVRLRAGQAVFSSLTFADDAPAVFAPLGEWSLRSVERSTTWWRSWSSRMRYEGPYREAVLRSALALKLLVYAPSGAIAAAPTTSLPEHIGGGLNWDYRYCWLRDASLTVRALTGLGYQTEAEAFTYWLIHSTRLTRPRLHALYDLFGNYPAVEHELAHVTGYRGSRPVRIGNAAMHQFQLDVYGEVIQAAFELVRSGVQFDRETRSMVCAFGEYIRAHWSDPDEGIWEPRTGRRHHTNSLLLCWAGLDRLIELHGKGHVCHREVDRLLESREAVRRELEQRAWNPRLQSYVSTLDGEELDASVLLMPWYGFERADSMRMKRTYQALKRGLGAADVLLYRNHRDETAGEGAFGVCGFWAAEYLALGGGTSAEATECFRRLLGYANDVGLFAEETDPSTGDHLGNFPQGFTHIGVINTAISLDKRLKGEKPLERELERAV